MKLELTYKTHLKMPSVKWWPLCPGGDKWNLWGRSVLIGNAKILPTLLHVVKPRSPVQYAISLNSNLVKYRSSITTAAEKLSRFIRYLSDGLYIFYSNLWNLSSDNWTYPSEIFDVSDDFGEHCITSVSAIQSFWHFALGSSAKVIP